MNNKRMYLCAYGNPGRGDDGLGNAFIVEVEKWKQSESRKNIFTESSYQLNIEDAAEIAGFDIVIFIDASKAEIESFSFSQVHPDAKQTFTTHSISPSALLSLCNELYNKNPLVYLLQIRGYEWQFEEQLSEKAKENLQKAVMFIKEKMTEFQNQE